MVRLIFLVLVLLGLGIYVLLKKGSSPLRNRREKNLYDELLRISKGDPGMVERLIEYEGRRYPKLNRVSLMEKAIKRVEHDRTR